MSSDQIPILKPELALSQPNQAQPAADELSAKLYADARNSIVKITTDQANALSGFIVDDGSHIVTATRNLIGSKEQFATGPDGKRYKLEIEKMDDLKDLAILKVISGKISGGKALSLGSTDALNAGDRVWALSFPQIADSNAPYLSLGYARSMTTPGRLLASIDPAMSKETIAKIEKMDAVSKSEANAYLNKPAIESKLHIEFGSGGGPVIAADGKVVGINTMTNANELRMGQTIAAPVEGIQELLNGKGRFEFTYKNVGSEWSEKYLQDWQTDKPTALAGTLVTGVLGGLAYKAATRLPIVASAGAGVYGFLYLSKDVNHLLRSADGADTLKYGLASASDLGTIGGAAVALAPKLRGYGIALMGLGVAAHAATDFIQNRRVLDKTTQLDGDPKRPPLTLDALLKKN